MNSRNVNLKDLSRYVIIRWYRIIICAVIVALLITAKQYKDSKAEVDLVKSNAASYAALDASGKEEYYKKHIGLDDAQKTQVTTLMTAEGKIKNINNILQTKLNEGQISEYNRQLEEVENSVKAIQIVMSQKQWDYYYYMKDNTVPEFTFTIPEITLDKKKVIETGLAGAILYVMVIIVRYLLNGSVRYTDDIKSFYGIDELGKVSFVRRKIAKIARPRVSIKDQNDIVAFDVDYVANNKGVGSVTFIGCKIDSKRINDVYNCIKDKLGESSIDAELITGDFNNIEQLEKLSSAQMVVLIELCGKSSDKKIREEIEKAKRYNLDIAGMVVVE